MKRRYELKERARRQSETRRRIVEAAVDLHTTVGPAHTSISAIAERAGVQRHTVYAHFPDERTLFHACSAHWRKQHPIPDFESLAQIEDPGERLRRSLAEMYAWYDSVESHLALFVRDAPLTASGTETLAETLGRIGRFADALARGWPRRRTVRAAIGHALEFESWRSLVRREGLSRKQAVEAMLRFVESV
jgi:AcrR family transcriptional regulator